MFAAARLMLSGVALTACAGEADRQSANNAAVADIEVLPADESAATTSGELANGASEPDAEELRNQH